MTTSSTFVPAPTTPARIINVHVLQAVPPSLLNRDDTGAQKTQTIGGTLRTRVSSQCWKRAMRMKFREEAIAAGAFAHRTNELPDEVAHALVAMGAVDNIEAARSKAAALFLSVGFNMKKSQRITNNSVFVHEDAAQRIANAMRDHLDEIVHTPGDTPKAAQKGSAPEKVKEAFKRAFDIDGAMDLALFGSFVAVGDFSSQHTAAVSANNACSVDPAQIVDDFFVAVDDNVVGRKRDASEDAREAATNNMGTSDLSSQVFYRTMALDVSQLRRNLNGDDALTRTATDAAIHAFISSVPAAKQTSTNAGTLPSLVLVSVGNARLTADNAFTRAIRSDNVVSDAVAALFAQVRYHSRFGVGQSYAVLAGDADADAQVPDPENFPVPLTVTDSLDELLGVISSATSEVSA